VNSQFALLAYLGEITSSQENTWQKTLDVFDDDRGKHEQKLLFADHATICERWVKPK
jgi:hypothetical protein